MNNDNIWLDYTKSVKHIQNYKNKVFLAQKNTSNKSPSNYYQSHFQKNSTIDLHGLTVDEAYITLKQFLQNSYLNHQKYLTIITGKGTKEKTSIIKLEVPRWLQYTELSTNVLKFEIVKNKFGEEEGAIKLTLRIKKGEF